MEDANAESVTSPQDANAESVTSPQDANAESVTSPHDANAESLTSPAGQSGKSKLDTLSKQDLIKFAKKQMVAMQRMKAKCAALEQEVLRPACGTADPSVIQELSERMSAVLQEKAESQQSLALLRREHEEFKKQAQETEGRLATLQEELDLKNIECAEMQRSTAELTAGFRAACTEYESKISQTQEELLEAKTQWTAATEALRESHQMSLTESQQEVENLQREMERLGKQYEDELRYLEEQMELNAADFERERERLLLLQDELSEQLALKEGFLQDVQEEEEDSNRAAPPQPLADSSASDDSSDEGGGLKLALEDLQAQNMMFQEELEFLRNVKVELESELKQVREEFTVEKEELEFTINELQMSKDSGEASVGKSGEARSISNEDVQTLEESHNQDSRELETCFSSSAERDQPEHVVDAPQDTRSPPPEDESMITRNNLRDRTEHFMKQYRAMKEQTMSSVQGLQDELESFFQERDSLLEHINAENTLDHAGKMSFEDLRNKTEEILGNLQHKETLVLEFMASESEGEHKETLVSEFEEKLKSMASESEREHKKTLVSEFEEKLKSMASESEREHKAQLAQICTLESRLLSVSVEKDQRINLLDEELSALQAGQEECQDTIKLLQAQIVCLSDEGNALRRDRDASQEHLSDVRSHITEILKQSFSETELDGTADVSALINHLWSKSLEEKALLTQQCDEGVERLAAELESARQSAEERQERVDELLREKHLLKASLEEVLLDTEGLQKDLREMQGMNEKLRAENLSLLAQVADLSQSSEEKEPADETDAQVHEANELQQVLADKDTLISQLKEEVGLLQTCKESSVSDENEKLKELSDEIEALKKASKDKDERMNKIKAVAVKAKKELELSKSEAAALREDVEQLKAERDRLARSVKDIIHGAEHYKNLLVDYDKQTERLEQADKHSEDLSRRLQSAVQQHELLSSERADLEARAEALQRTVTQLEAQTLDMQKLERELEAERLLREQKTKEHHAAVKEVEELQAQLSKHTHQLHQTAQELEQLRKGAQQSSLMDMEMADYEKLVKELNHKLSERDKQAEEHQLHMQTQREREQRLNQDIESLKSSLDQTEEKASRMKQLLVKTKKDLGDAKQREAAQMISQASLRGELEAHQQQLEEYKIQCSDLTAERHRLQEQLKLMNEQHTHTSRSQQLSVKKLQDESAAAKADLAATVSEFESYKVRVHNVLKQQKHKSSGQSEGDAFRQEREQMEAGLEQLRRRLQETQTSLQCSTAELQQLQTDHDTLLERHNKILQESVSKEAELRERLLSLQSESVSLRSEHGQCAAQLSAQTEALRISFREQTRLLQDEHCRTVETLQQQVNRLETQLYSLQREPVSAVHHPQGRKAQADRKPADASALDLQGDREEGEGMETAETESLSSTVTPLTSLEQLLTSDLKHEPADWQMEPSKEELTVKLSSAARSVEHLNGLLHETEATNAVLTEQITLLKSEVRRLERNHEREKSVANLEYLKNVLLQFLFLRSGSERQALLPVIHTMLQLSPDEKSKLAAIAHGEEQPAGSQGSGWTSYLHSWSGIR
ncbi:GRIP and coiled-coil domain-containing protein 2 isoform X2 [Rhinichthys klamathensis goyatoka]|uniref:GRIP and coiled-coil domain-containing protein 2 isoform X2 n=1 Tax=Rhinichthys klamathensis goyatoka TaxID=3034132 RepID=UPI0024B4ABDC|nr:GRIP and coiled-coil domain-containing protein 2 isoform X2 [Rhinichthys klamathensis goyatoka]